MTAVQIPRLAFVGSYVPHQYGLAPFDANLLSEENRKDFAAFTVVVSDRSHQSSNPSEVSFQLEKNDLSSYLRAAEFINLNEVDVVCLQHEFGIFGGNAGSHILALLGELDTPVVTTLHSVEKKPDAFQRRVLQQVLEFSSRVVVINPADRKSLLHNHQIANEKIDLIPVQHSESPNSRKLSSLRQQVTRAFIGSLEQARLSWRAVKREISFSDESADLPPLSIEHLISMTDSTGVFQHAKYTVPNFDEGYCTDDNARALIFAVLGEELQFSPAELHRIAKTSLAFLNHALNLQTGRFRNFMSFSREWLEEVGSEDSHGRALWALGTAIGRSRFEGIRMLGGQLMKKGMEPVLQFSSPRAWAFSLLGIHEYLRCLGGDCKAADICRILTERLMQLFDRHADVAWPWFEPMCTYDNAKLPHALILSGGGRALETGLRSLKWLLEVQTAQEGYFRPIGCRGWYPRGGECARYDQQPLEAHSVLSACIEAHGVTGEEYWLSRARMVFEWFLGRNDLGKKVCDSESGGCRDALHIDRVNRNQGAESTLAYLLSLAEMHRMETIKG
ncbi:MAG: glycosyltransferase [Chitinispirillaceae bacterium]